MKNAGIRVYKKKVGDFEGVFIILVMALTFEDDDVSDFLSLRLLIFIFIILFSEKENRDESESERYFWAGCSR